MYAEIFPFKISLNLQLFILKVSLIRYSKMIDHQNELK